MKGGYTSTKDLNLDFLDLYKRVDRFIRDAYASEQGISIYISLMDSKAYTGPRYAPAWKTDYDMLKRVRWIRNQLVHEVGYDCPLCQESDYEWLNAFYGRLYSAEDPLSVLYHEEYVSQQRRAKARQAAQQKENRILLQEMEAHKRELQDYQDSLSKDGSPASVPEHHKDELNNGSKKKSLLRRFFGALFG